MLTFEEFVRVDRAAKPNYGNFHMHFVTGGIGPEFYRKTPHYQRFMHEHTDTDTELTEKITNRYKFNISTTQSLKPFEREMYDAYVIMYGYGASNRELFS